MVSTISKESAKIDLSGVWECKEDSGIYYLTQYNENVYWCGRSTSPPYSWCNVAYGILDFKTRIIRMSFGDIPIEKNKFFGRIDVAIDLDCLNLTRVSESVAGPFGGKF